MCSDILPCILDELEMSALRTFMHLDEITDVHGCGIMWLPEISYKKSGARAQNSIFESTLRTRDPHLFNYF
jgi:hypothetical protein